MKKSNHPNVCSFDTETTGLSPYSGARIFAYCIGHWDGTVEVYRMKEKKALSRLQKFFADTSIEKVCHNFKFDYAMVKTVVPVPDNTIWHDTMIMAQLARNDEQRYTLDYLAWKYGQIKVPEDDLVEQWVKQTGSYERVPEKIMRAYQIADGQRTMALYRMYAPFLQSDLKLWNDYRNEIELVKVTQKMEQHGILYDHRKAQELMQWLNDESEKALTMLNRYNQGDINPNSPKDVEQLLFRKLGLPVIRYTPTGRVSLKKDVLIQLFKQCNHEALHAVLKYRSYTMGISKIEGFAKFADGKGFIHPNINTNHARTGRESCDNPNLQNVSKENVNTDVTPYPVPMRRCFRAEPDCIMVFADYAGIEMRLIVNATGEPELMDVLKQRGDVHHPTVQCFLGVEKADQLRDTDKKIYKAIRNTYKNVGFCVAYGGSPLKVAMTIGKPLEEIADGDRMYRQRFRRIAGFSRFLASRVEKDGFIVTPFGRKLYVPREEAYIASNYMIQGTAAGILKRAQVRLGKLIEERYSKLVSLVLPIHDELVFSFRREALPYFAEIRTEFSNVMCDMPEVSAPLDVEWKWTTTTWDKAKEVT